MEGCRKGYLIFIFSVLLAWSVPAPAAEHKLSLGVGFDFATGDYGTDTNTDSLAVPFIVDFYPTDRLDFELVIPYIYQSNSNTLFINGMRFPMGQTARRRMTSFNVNESQSGLGDITLSTGYALFPETEARPLVRPVLYLRFPTGDEDKALGTGEMAAGPGLGLSKWLDNWNVFGEGRYIFQGSNSDFGLKDYFTAEGEVGYLLAENFFPSINLWYSTPPTDDSPNLLDLRLKAKYRWTDTIHFEGYLLKGLTNGTPDFGLGGSVFFRF